MQITFCGAAESVTGSCHLVEIDGPDPGDASVKILLDCGQFQGSSKQDAQNFEAFPFDPTTIDFLILSHAHIDHCGRIPLLVKRGFHGRIYASTATADLLPVMLRDSAHIHEMEASWKNRKALRKGEEPVQPLFTSDDAENSLTYVTPVLYDEPVDPVQGVRFSFVDAGHILGSSIVELWAAEAGKETKLVFSGDLGVGMRPILRDPTQIRTADVVIMESTYGNRLHENSDSSLERFEAVIRETAARGGDIIIPSFAVGRTQELIYELNKFYEATAPGDIMHEIKVYIDSPMAVAATEVFRNNVQVFDEYARSRILAGDDPLDFPNLIFTRTTDESKSINTAPSPKVIISASGMCEAGRIRHHLKHHLWDKRNSVVFVGFQAEGTLGRKLVEGTDSVHLFGEEVRVKAQIHSLEGFSAHADRDGLLEWVKGFDKKPRLLFLVHGEIAAKEALAQSIAEQTGLRATVIREVSTFDVAADKPIEVQDGAAFSKLQAGEKDGGAEVDADDADRVLAKLTEMNDNIERLIYEAKLAVTKSMDERDDTAFGKLKKTIASLEYDTMQLAGALADSNGGKI
ncbi:MBL fold hydrolase [Clostridia bacterium]|nr:MBL fold hydrolase [Clostridia bacterium]